MEYNDLPEGFRPLEQENSYSDLPEGFRPYEPSDDPFMDESNYQSANKDPDSSWAFSVDQAQKLGGKGFRELGNFIGSDYISEAGQNYVDEQEADILAGGYSPEYQGTIRENYAEGGISQALGKTWEMIGENAAYSGAALGGSLLAAVTVPFSVPAALVIGGTTTAGTVLLGTGEAAEEMEDQGLEVNSGTALGVGVLIGLLEKFGADKVVPKKMLAKITGKKLVETLVQAGKKDAAKAIGKEIFKKTGYEVGTELAQESLIMGGALSEGGKYTEDDLIDRFIDTAAVSGAMGAGFSVPSVAADVSQARDIRNNGGVDPAAPPPDIDPNLADQQAREETANAGGDILEQELNAVQARMLAEAKQSTIQKGLLAQAREAEQINEQNTERDALDAEYDLALQQASQQQYDQVNRETLDYLDQRDSDFRTDQEVAEIYQAIHEKAKGRTAASKARIAAAAQNAEQVEESQPVLEGAMAQAFKGLNIETQSEQKKPETEELIKKEKPITGFDNERETVKGDELKAADLAMRQRLGLAPKNALNTVKPEKDTLKQAINKLGGVKLSDTDSKDVGRNSMFRKSGGKPIDDIAEGLAQLGYLPLDSNGKHDIKDLQALMDKQQAGENVYAKAYYNDSSSAEKEAEAYYAAQEEAQNNDFEIYGDQSQEEYTPVNEELASMEDLDRGDPAEDLPFMLKNQAGDVDQDGEGTGLYTTEQQDITPTEEDIRHETGVDVAAKEAAHSTENDLPEPTDAQKEAGNYKKGHASLHGLNISIENPKGSTRSGTSKQGKEWASEMNSHYGYIKGTIGKDKDHVDVFITDGAEKADKAFVIDQVDPDTKKFDEHKVVIGAATEQDALAEYNKNYDKGWQGAGAVTEMPMSEFKTWVMDKSKTKKPAGDLGRKSEISDQKSDVDTEVNPVTPTARETEKQSKPKKPTRKSKSKTEVKLEEKEGSKDTGKPLSEIMLTTETDGRQSAEFHLKNIDARLDALSVLKEVC